MKATIINIGDELLIGQVVNTNASTMASMLTADGFDVVNINVIGDNEKDILTSIDGGMKVSDVTLVTGGLGPTKDDITKHVLCHYFHSELYEEQVVVENVRRLFAMRNLPLTDTNRAQALVPRACKVINNLVGTAPAMWFEQEGRVLVSLPGVPYEMQWLMTHEIMPRLNTFFNAGVILNKNIITQGIGESFLSDMVENWENALPSSIRLAYLPQAGMVKMRLTARGSNREELQKEIDKAVAELYQVAGKYIIGEDCESMQEVVAMMMKSKGKTLATAESCTGGAIASRITAISGVSQFFKGGVVSYSNEVKQLALGVEKDVLERYGAVSEQVVRQMVEGVRTKFGTDYAVATTGIAGPDGGTPTKPVGTVWISAASKTQTIAEIMHFGNQRQQNIERSVNHAFAMLIRLLCQED